MNGSLLCSALCIPDLLLGRRERAAEKVHYYGSIMGQLMFRILSKPPVVIGLENLPPDGEKGMVYVSNHQTSVDIALFYYIGAERKFSWVSKSTVFLIPGVGLLMKIAGYVALTRGNRDSVKKMFDDCKERLAAGWSVMIFPQGTRRRLKVLDFKDGAFQLAIDSNSVVVPFTLDLPENLFRGPRQRTKITVHEPIRPGDPAFKDVTTLRKHCFDTVMVSPLVDTVRLLHCKAHPPIHKPRNQWQRGSMVCSKYCCDTAVDVENLGVSWAWWTSAAAFVAIASGWSHAFYWCKPSLGYSRAGFTRMGRTLAEKGIPSRPQACAMYRQSYLAASALCWRRGGVLICCLP
ncbi:unnamed protein product [Ectocarpus sp. 6 AP-2014]